MAAPSEILEEPAQSINEVDPLFIGDEPVFHTSRVTENSLLEEEAVPITTVDAESTEEYEPYVKRRLYKSELLQIWNLAQIIRNLGTREACVNFAEEQGLILTSMQCHVHKKPMRIDYTANKTVGAFVCSKGSCRTKRRIYRSVATWFENIKLNLTHVFYIMYCFSHLWSHDKVIWEDFLRTEKKCTLSSTTISDWYNYCRETIVIYQLDKQQCLGKIGGPGKVIQIEEYKFGKRKYNKGKNFEGQWLIGLIEDGSDNIIVEVIDDIQSNIIVTLLEKHVEKGTTIHTDSWHAYNSLNDYDYIHKKISLIDPEKPSINFKDDLHIQHMESQWKVVKKFFKKNNYKHHQDFGNAIVEYSWRRDIFRQKKDPFLELIKAVRHVYKPK